MIRRPPRSTLFPYTRSSDLSIDAHEFRAAAEAGLAEPGAHRDRKSTRLNSSHLVISYAVFCLKKKKQLMAKEPIDDFVYVCTAPSFLNDIAYDDLLFCAYMLCDDPLGLIFRDALELLQRALVA